MTLQTVKCYINVGRQLDTNHIDQPARRRRPTGSNRLDIILTPDDTLGVKKARGKLSVVTRRAHGHRDALLRTPAVGTRVGQTDLERFLRCDYIFQCPRTLTDPLDL
jgi:hypothetical protein